jgi:glutathione-regulated potassium-efflux system ancillary protein KefC
MQGNLLFALFALLAATVALVPLAKWLGLGTILGYLAAGILIGPYALGLVTDTELIRVIADFGIVLMLFLIGLEMRPADLWRLRRQMLGLGLTQIVLTSAVLMAVVMLIGLSWQSALIVALALSMSSTAIAMQSVDQRNLAKTDTGRASLAVLLVQDVAVIPILAAIPVLALMSGSPADVLVEGATEAVEFVEGGARFGGWVLAFGIVGTFIAALLGSRFVIRPLMHFVAATHAREAFTALALALVVGAALGTSALGMSPALGAFIGGVLLSDSEYRHELEGNLAPFKDLLLGLFFVSVGMSIEFSVVLASPLLVLALVAALVSVKMLVLFVLSTFFRMHLGDRLLLAILLSQAGEFAFVILQFAQNSGAITSNANGLLTVVVALSMAATPLLLLLFDRVWAPRQHTTAAKPASERIDEQHKIIVLGYGRFGQIITRLLRAQGFEMTLIDDDPAQIELVKRFGVKVFYGDGGRLDILRAAGADRARMIVIAVAGGERILRIADLIRRNFPHVIVVARAIDRSHAHDLMALGVNVFERETFRSALTLGRRALEALGYSPDSAQRLADAFERHDNHLLHDSFGLRHDQDAYIGLVKRSAELLDEVMRADRDRSLEPPDEGNIDKPHKAGSE